MTEVSFYQPEWLEILRIQDAQLRMERLSSDDALKLGLIMVRLAKEKYHKPVAIRIIASGQVLFSHLMEGTDLHNEWWMDRKLNTVRLSGVSSLRTAVEIGEGIRTAESGEYEPDKSFALCGGCIPVRNAQDRIIAYVLCSGMAHEMDHQLIADALSEITGIPVPEIRRN